MTDPLTKLSAALEGRYAIERELGAGGMATVYLAHDVKHDRKVALKLLRPELAAVLGVDRFLNEIRVTANLQHPHILPLYDSGEADGFLFYVMPFVDGETLGDRLEREKQVGIEDAVRIATEMASALDYAHRQGVVHRDIKPANVLLLDGQVLVADFGIALALKAAGGDRLTETGLSLGTPHYMSPEQAAGDRDVDARTDLYALGAVLYEMLAGEPPHTGSTVQAILSRVLTEAPRPVTDIRRSVPAHVAVAVERALAKVPADRFATVADFGTALKDPQFALSHAMTASAVRAGGTGPWWRDWRSWTAALVVAALGVAVGRSTGTDDVPERGVARFGLTVEGGQGLTGAPVNTLALSPDGGMVVYVGRVGGGVQLYLRRLDELATHPIPATLGATFPVFSPDGSRLAYFGPGGMFLVPIGGGATMAVPNVPSQALAQAIWADDESFVATAGDGSLVRVGLDGSVAVIAVPDQAAGERYLAANTMLPDGRHVLAVAAPAGGFNGRVVAFDVLSAERTDVIEAETNAVWYSDGHLLWAQPNGALLGAAFDVDRLRITGAPITLAEGVRLSVGGPAQVAVSAIGSMVYIPEQPFNLMLLDRSGAREVIGEGRRFHSPRFSPDGRWLAVDFPHQSSRDIWSLDLRQRTLARITFENDGHDVVWTPDGRYLAYVSRNGVYRRRSDGSGVAESLYVGPVLTSIQTFTPDGSLAITAATGSNGGFDLGVLTLGEDREEQPLLASPFNEQYAALSPDGRWLAYSSDETGRDEVYIRPFPDGGAKVLVSLNGGREPMWAPAGDILYYIGEQSGAPFLMQASVAARGTDFVVRDRTALFDVSEFEPASPHANYDVSPDGTRFAMVHQGQLDEIVIVLNWTEEVRRRSERR